jgi:hypothetical protein
MLQKNVVYILVYPDGTVGYTVFHQRREFDTGRLTWFLGESTCGPSHTTIQHVKEEKKYSGITIYKIVRIPKFPS